MAATRSSRSAVAPAKAVWRAAASPGGLIGMMALLACLAATAFLVLRVLPGQDAPGMKAVLWVFTAVLAALGLSVLYLLYGYFTLSYVLDRQAVTIIWGRSRYVIPLSAVEYVGPATEMLGGRTGASVPWPGYYLESYPLPEGASVRTFATQPLHRQVALCTADAIFALSPERPVRFMEDVVRLRDRATDAGAPIRPRRLPEESAAQLNVTQPMPIITPAGRAGAATRPAVGMARRAATTTEAAADAGGRPISPGRRLSAPPGVLRDNAARTLLILAALLNVALVAYILWKLPTASDRIPLHFNALGQVDRIGQPREIFVLPGITLGVLVVNALLAMTTQRYDAFAARLLLAGPIVTALTAWVAVVNLL